MDHLTTEELEIELKRRKEAAEALRKQEEINKIREDAMFAVVKCQNLDRLMAVIDAAAGKLKRQPVEAKENAPAKEKREYRWNEEEGYMCLLASDGSWALKDGKPIRKRGRGGNIKAEA